MNVDKKKVWKDLPVTQALEKLLNCLPDEDFTTLTDYERGECDAANHYRALADQPEQYYEGYGQVYAKQQCEDFWSHVALLKTRESKFGEYVEQQEIPDEDI